MTTNLSDTDLIAAIAKKFGWKKRIPDTRFPDMCVWFFEGEAYESHKLPSTDACLKLVEAQKLMATLEVWPHQNIATLYKTEEGPFFTGKDSESLPRAILKVLLEVE